MIPLHLQKYIDKNNFLCYLLKKEASMSKLTDKQIENILKYNTGKAYFGDFTARSLSNSVGRIKTSWQWDKPIEFININIGHIDGDVICNALWREMSYNPVRFGTVSPFRFKGKNSLYHFCNSSNNHALTPENMEIFSKIRYHLTCFMTLNAHPNGAWNDTIIGQILTIRLENGHSNCEYKMLAHLRDCIKIITTQNINDFKDKTKQYRAGIISRINNLYYMDTQSPVKTNTEKNNPVLFQPTIMHIDNSATSASMINKNNETSQSVSLEYDYDAHIDNQIESLKIILENKTYYDSSTYEQALKDYEYLIANQCEDHSR